MNEARIAQATRTITECKAALKWLEEYGGQLRPGDKSSVDVVVHLGTAGSCAGAKEAAAMLGAFARFEIESLIETAKRNCRNTIELERDVIRLELDRDD